MQKLKAKLAPLFMISMAVLSWLSACADGTSPPNPPLSFPFSVEKAGNKVESVFRINKERYYSFSILLLSKKGDKADRERVRKLAGDPQVDMNGKPTNPGTQIPLRLKLNLVTSAGEKTILEKEISEQKLWAQSEDGFSRLIDAAILKPGDYRVSVESLKDVPQLEGTPVSFEIAYGHFK